MRIRGRDHPKESDSPSSPSSSSSSSSVSSIDSKEGTTLKNSLRETSDLSYVDSSTLRSRFAARPAVSSRTVSTSRFTPRNRVSDPSSPASSSRRYQITTQRLVSKQFTQESSKPEIGSTSSSPSTTESMPASASASSTTEEFTVSPAAHVIRLRFCSVVRFENIKGLNRGAKLFHHTQIHAYRSGYLIIHWSSSIRYTLDSNEVTSELSISQDDVNNLVNDFRDPLKPQKLVSTFPMPSDVFR